MPEDTTSDVNPCSLCVNVVVPFLDLSCSSSIWGLFFKNLAPGEARTPDLRISLSVLTYKYDALTDCATGAMVWRLFSQVLVLCTCSTSFFRFLLPKISQNHLNRSQSVPFHSIWSKITQDSMYFQFRQFLFFQNFHRPMRDLNPRPSD